MFYFIECKVGGPKTTIFQQNTVYFEIKKQPNFTRFEKKNFLTDLVNYQTHEMHYYDRDMNRASLKMNHSEINY